MFIMISTFKSNGKVKIHAKNVNIKYAATTAVSHCSLPRHDYNPESKQRELSERMPTLQIATHVDATGMKLVGEK